MEDVKVLRHKQTIPTYIPGKPNDLPMFFENKPYQGASGRLYPIPYSDKITDEKKDVDYDVYTLENEYLKVQVLPEIGGKILRGYDKVGSYDFIYHNEVVKPALVGLGGAWISGGIEFNWPQHHRPTTFMPLEAVSEENPDGGKTVWTGEVEPFNRMKGMAGITLDKGRSYIKAKIRVYNRTSQPQIFMWWANLAVPVNDDYRTVFPPDVEWVNDHDRRAVMSWPIAKGTYHTARPYNFGDGTDLTRYDAVKVPSSYLVSQGQSDMDFVAGYDTGIRKGIATVADHHIAPGKKMWHWGIGDFGDMWCNNLTDKNGPYIELMTGVYTDNQPDFTWLAPYESREFEQYWYPIRDIGEIKNASIDAAVNMEMHSDGLFIGFNVTGAFPDARVTVCDRNHIIFTETVSMTPDVSYLKTIPVETVADLHDITVRLTDCTGKTLISYNPPVRGNKKPITPRQPVKRPCEIDNIEELYINGYHLEQYKQHNYKPEDYYLEALKRDPGDIRCNTSMARLALKNGRFEDCIKYCDKALERLTMRNFHPTDTESYYLKGLALVYTGKDQEAYDTLYKAAWNYTHRSAALFELACLDCKSGEYAAALEKLEESMALNNRHSKAANLKTAILRKLNAEAAYCNALENLTADRLDLFAKVEFTTISAIAEDSLTAEIHAQIAEFAVKAENILDVAADYLKAGLYQDALYALSLYTEEHPLIAYYKGYIKSLMGEDGTADIVLAESLDTGICFPARLEDIAVLKFVINSNTQAANACYYLGCLYYDRFRYEEAAELWNEGLQRANISVTGSTCDTSCGKMYRNLALYYFDKADQPEQAKQCLEKAMLLKQDPRLLFEYQQLLKNMHFAPEHRLAVYEQYPELLAQRDDCYLDQLTLVSQTGDYEKAINMAKIKRFHIYEGGEGKLTKQHAWMHVLYGNRLALEGKSEKAEEIYKNGINMPKSYGEAKTFFNQEAHIYYYLGCLYEKAGRTEETNAAYEQAAVYKAAVSEISLFRALALLKLNRPEEAHDVLDEMLASAENSILNKDRRSYYGVGSPSPMPFEYNIEKNNLTDGYILKAFALLGKAAGGQSSAKEDALLCIAKAGEMNPYDFRIFTFRNICDTF